MIYVPYTLLLSLKELHLDGGVPSDQVSTGMHSLQMDFSTLENNLSTHSRLQAVRQPTWSRGWAAEYVKIWDIFSMVWSLPCAPLPGISLLQSCHPTVQGAMQRVSHLLKEPNFSKGHEKYLSVLRLSKHRSCSRVQGQPCSALALSSPSGLGWTPHPCWAALACAPSLCNPQRGTDRVYTRTFSLVQKIAMIGLKNPLIFIAEIQIGNSNK